MTNTRKILIVDDDSELREALVEQLALHEEFESIAVDNGTKGVQTAKAGQIDLVIMDVGLPDVDGREAVRILRKNGFKAPIIMLTGHNTDSDTILGLESGANDYVTKPFRFAVLLARIRAQLRQHEASEDAIFTIGPYTRSLEHADLAPLRISKSPPRLEFGLRAYTCQQRRADFWRALKEALHGISRSVETRFRARLARLPVPVDEEQFAYLARG
jgi:DNA-binding response OmpR family regulator